MNASTQSVNQLAGYNLTDAEGNKLGSVDSVWLNGTTSDPEFVGVKTTPLIGKTHIVPLRDAQIDNDNQTIEVPYTQDQIKGAPAYDPNTVLSQDVQSEIYDYYSQTETASVPVGKKDTETVVSRLADALPLPTHSGQPPGSQPDRFPVDDVTYDLYTLIHEKLKGLEAYDQYLGDADSQDLTDLLRALRYQDAQAVNQLQQYLVQRLCAQNNASS
jgi:hypothetical protein